MADLKFIKDLKNYVIESQCYELAAYLRDIERNYFMDSEEAMEIFEAFDDDDNTCELITKWKYNGINEIDDGLMIFELEEIIERLDERFP